MRVGGTRRRRRVDTSAAGVCAGASKCVGCVGVPSAGRGRGTMVGRSKVWRLAQFIDESRTMVACSLCPVRIKYVGNTTNIARHLELRHPQEFAALDPLGSAGGRPRQSPRQQLQHQNEEAAICRILAQHREELQKQVEGGVEEQPVKQQQQQQQQHPMVAVPVCVGSRSPGLITAQQWSWHTPVHGVPVGPEDRPGNTADYTHPNSVDLPITVSPDHFLSEGNIIEEEPPPILPQITSQHQKPESYQLRHNNHLTIVLEALARDESFMDVTLTAQGRSLKAHKSVLSAVSSYFRGVLRDNPCQHPIIIMPRDVRFEELISIVNYIYKGEMTVAAEDLTSLLKTAEILQVSGLAPADSSATVNPQNDSLLNLANANANPNARSSSNSSSASSPNPNKPNTTTTSSSSKPRRRTKTSTLPSGSSSSHSQSLATPPARPKSIDCLINPADFIDIDMTCVKEEVMSGEEDEKNEESPSKAKTQTPHQQQQQQQQQQSDCNKDQDTLQQQQQQQHDSLDLSQNLDYGMKEGENNNNNDDDDEEEEEEDEDGNEGGDEAGSDQVVLGFPTPYEQNFDDQPMASTSSQDTQFAATGSSTGTSSSGVKSSSNEEESNGTRHSNSNKPSDSPQPLKCPHCDEQYRDVDSIDSHLRLKHPTKPSFTCKCGRIFTRQIHHQAHVRMCPSLS